MRTMSGDKEKQTKAWNRTIIWQGRKRIVAHIGTPMKALNEGLVPAVKKPTCSERTVRAHRSSRRPRADALVFR